MTHINKLFKGQKVISLSQNISTG